LYVPRTIHFKPTVIEESSERRFCAFDAPYYVLAACPVLNEFLPPSSVATCWIASWSFEGMLYPERDRSHFFNIHLFILDRNGKDRS
jgi:hypothetical protein